MTLTLALENSIEIGGTLTGTGWALSTELTQDQWRQAGAMLAKVEQSKQWWLGDWWNAGKWGDGQEACEQVGVEYQTAQNAGWVCRAFEISRRREILSFKHHAEVCAIPDPAVQDRLLDWACEGEKPKSTRELRDAVRQYLDEQGWTDDEKERRELIRNEYAVVANLKTDERLIRWAQFENKLVKIDRTSDWGNPFVMPGDGDRDIVCDSYAVYLSLKPSLLKKVPELKGKVLACWCYPERCHGDHIARLVADVVSPP